jgi:hypothetical protein
MIQTSMNNSSNVFIELFSNELIYEFKVKDIFFALFTSENFRNISISKILQILEKIRLRNRQKAVDAVFFVNVKVKIFHDKRHKSLFLKSEEKVFFRLHKDYNLFEIINKKLSQQKCDSFIIKRRVDRLAYKLNLFSRWKIHLVISMTQLEFVSNDFYNRLRSDHLDSVFVKKDIFINKFYEMKKVLVKRIRKYENFSADQYLIKWKEYESEFDEWRIYLILKTASIW